MHDSSRSDGQRKLREDFCQKNVVLCFHSVSHLSGIRESNPPFKLGKLAHYRCANSAFRADTRTRTEDLFITNELLYQLSHIGGHEHLRLQMRCKGIFFF